MRLRRREEKVAWLRRVPLFAELSAAQLEALMPLVEEVEAEAGRVLIQEGEYGRELIIFIDGTAEVTRDGEHVRDLGAGDIVGEIALLDGGVRTATVTVREPTHVLTISKPRCLRCRRGVLGRFADRSTKQPARPREQANEI